MEIKMTTQVHRNFFNSRMPLAIGGVAALGAAALKATSALCQYLNPSPSLWDWSSSAAAGPCEHVWSFIQGHPAVVLGSGAVAISAVLMLRNFRVQAEMEPSVAEQPALQSSMPEVVETPIVAAPEPASVTLNEVPAGLLQKTLDFSWMALSDAKIVEFAARLHDNRHVQELLLGTHSMSHIGATALAEMLQKNSTLYRLFLGKNQIGDKGMVILAGALQVNKTLKVLSLGSNQVGDAGMVALSETLQVDTDLRELHLGDNPIGDDGIVALAKALRTNTGLRKLHLGRVLISDHAFAALNEALEVNTSLQELHLGYDYPQLTPNRAFTLDEMLKINRDLQKIEYGNRRSIVNASFQYNRILASNQQASLRGSCCNLCNLLERSLSD
jgi:hypothetical protein